MTKIWDEINDRHSVTELHDFGNGRVECLYGNTDSPSLQLYDGSAYCFSCEKYYDYISFYAELHNLSWHEAFREVCEQDGIQLTERDEHVIEMRIEAFELISNLANYCHEHLMHECPEMRDRIKDKREWTDDTLIDRKIGLFDEDARDWLEELVNEESLENAGLKQNGRWVTGKRITYPYFNRRKEIEYMVFGGIINPDFINGAPGVSKWIDGLNGKYRKLHCSNLEHLQNPVYGRESIYRNRNFETLIIAEGVPDCISAIQAGYKSISPVGGNFSHEQMPEVIRICKRFDDVYVVYDSEQSGHGQKNARRLIPKLLKAGIKVSNILIPRDEDNEKIDLDDYLNTHDDMEDLIENHAKDGYIVLLDNITDNPREMDDDIKKILKLIPDNQRVGVTQWLKEIICDERGLMNKRPFNKLSSDAREIAEREVEEDEMTYKERVEEIADEIIDELNIITLDDSEQVMVRTPGEVAYRFDKNPLIDKILEKNRLRTRTYTKYVREVKKMVKHKTRFRRDDFTVDKHKIPFKNGVLDISGEDDVFTYAEDIDGKHFYQLKFDYETVNNAPDTPERFERCFREWFYDRVGDGDREMYMEPENLELTLDDIYEMIGLCLTTNTEFKTHFMAYGPPDTGKTIIKDLIASVYPEDCTISKSLHAMTQRFGKSGLQFKVFVYSDETPRSTIYDTGPLKEITGGAEEKIEADIKNSSPIQFRPFMKFWWCANKLPKINESDKATFIRFILLHFRNSFTDDPDRDLRDTLKEELASIIKNAIDGYKRLMERGTFRHELKEETEHEWKMASDDIYRIIHTKFEITHRASDWITKDDALQIFIAHSDETISKSKLTREIKKYGVRIRRVEIGNDRPYVYAGIKRKSDNN